MDVQETRGYLAWRQESGSVSMTKSIDRKSGLTGFTLIEMLAVIGIIAILVTVLFPSMNKAFRNARRGRAQHEIGSLVAAIKSYHSEYGKWPCPKNGEDDQTFDADTQAQVINLLTNNSSRKVFLEVPSNSSTNGCYLDPWNNPYLITLDTDFDNNCKITSAGAGRFNGSNIMNKGVCVWSWGEPEGGEKAVITSW